MTYPRHHHQTCNALIAGNVPRARAALARSLRAFRAAGEHDRARSILAHAAWISFPLRIRPDGRYR